MASPQKENGYTAIANEIMESLARIRINGEAVQILLVIIRKTYGFNKKEDAISLSQFVSATGLPKPTVCKALRKLKIMNIVTQKANAIANIYSINKDYSTWRPLPKKPTLKVLPKKEMTITQKANNRYPKSHIQKTVTKDTLTKEKKSGDFFPSKEYSIELTREGEETEKTKKSEPKNTAAIALRGKCYALLEKETGVRPITSMKDYLRCLEARKHLTDEQVLDMVEDSITNGDAEKSGNSLGAILSNIKITKYKLEYA